MTDPRTGTARLLAAALMAVLSVPTFVACASSPSRVPPGAASPASSVSTSTPTQELSLSSSPSEGVDSSLQPLIDQAVADLATLLTIDRSVITVISAEAVVWPDKSLGCPQPGMLYNQVIVDGARIELGAHGKSYSYHSGGGRPPFRCDKG